MVKTNAQDWLTTKVTGWKNAKQIYGTKDGKHSPEEKDREFLTGDLVIENLNELEELLLYDVRELNNVVIKNCLKLRKVNLLNSGVQQLKIGPGLNQIEDLSIGFEVDLPDRSVARKLDNVDLSQVTNLKEIRCVGVQETELIGFEKLTQLEVFRGNKNVKIPNKKFSKWKDNLDIITTGPDSLDLLKGGTGPDKDDVDRAKLDDYKNRPTKGQLDNANKKVKEYEDGLKADLGLDDKTLPTWRNEIAKLKNTPASSPAFPITKEQWDNDYSKRPTRQELEQVKKDKEKIQRLHDAIRDGAINRFGENRWKVQLEIEQLYNSIEQANK